MTKKNDLGVIETEGHAKKIKKIRTNLSICNIFFVSLQCHFERVFGLIENNGRIVAQLGERSQ